MRIVVVGGYGLIGGYVVARLAGDGHEVIGAGREVTEARRRFPDIRWTRIDLATADRGAWREALADAAVIVNCAGALQDSVTDRLRAAHVRGFATMIDAARDVGVTRVVHISAAGAAMSPGSFGETKRAAEAALMERDLDWIVLRPGLVLAPAAFGGSALLRGLAAFPLAIPVVDAGARLQVASAGDVADAVAAAVRPDAPTRTAIDLVAAEEVGLGELLRALRGWLGLAPAPVLQLPMILTRPAAAAADGLAYLGWRSPMRTNAIAQLGAGVLGEAGAAERMLGMRMRGLPDILRANPSGVQERWFARMYFLKPLSLIVLAVFWALSGVNGIIGRGRAAALLLESGFGHGAATTVVLLGSAVDIALAVLVSHRKSVRLGLLGMLAASAAYVVGASIWRPDLWGDPLGPVLKIFPSALLACVALATLDER